jgi:hypothetical protein
VGHESLSTTILIKKEIKTENIEKKEISNEFVKFLFQGVNVWDNQHLGGFIFWTNAS